VDEITLLRLNGPMRRVARSLALTAAALFVVGGCAVGSVRQAKVGGLARYPEAGAIAVATAEANPGAVPDTSVGGRVAAGALGALATAGLATVDVTGHAGEHLTLRFDVLEAVAPGAPSQGLTSLGQNALSSARSWIGLAGAGDAGAAAGRLVIEGRLYTAGQREVGYVRWEHEGAPEALAAGAGEESAQELARLVAVRRRDTADRRAADERLLLTPTPLTLEAGEFVVSDDELILARIGTGLSRRVQLDLWAGGFPIPGAGATGGAGHGLIGVGAAGAIVLGFFDLGLKVRLLDETRVLPAVAVAYDLLDVFGLGAGGAGLVVFGNGAGGGGFGVVAGANAQFNLLTAVAGKHFGPVHVTAGTYVLDNHHYLPQSAAFQAGCGGAATDGSGGTAGAIPCGSGYARLGRLPTQVQPFVGSEVVLGPHSAIMADWLIGDPLASSVASTGVRWLLGGSRPRGVLALDRVRFRIDLAAVWLFESADHQSSMQHGARALPLPWAGVGLYFL
jgi:hypothetical protein